MEIKTTTGSNNIRYYKNFLAQALSIFPQQVNVLGAKKDNAQTKTTGCRNYVVSSGDSLWQIAQNKLGSGKKYRDILNSNNLDSNLLRIGQTLKLGC